MSDVIGLIVSVIVLISLSLTVFMPMIVGEETIRSAKKKGVIK
jgi:hypothetical protein